MPKLNGPDATAVLRQRGYTGTILGVTGNVLQEDVDYFISKGADDVLPKPVSMALLNNYWKSHASPREETSQEKTKPPSQQIVQKSDFGPPDDTNTAAALAA